MQIDICCNPGSPTRVTAPTRAGQKKSSTLVGWDSPRRRLETPISRVRAQAKCLSRSLWVPDVLAAKLTLCILCPSGVNELTSRTRERQQASRSQPHRPSSTATRPPLPEPLTLSQRFDVSWLVRCSSQPLPSADMHSSLAWEYTCSGSRGSSFPQCSAAMARQRAGVPSILSQLANR